MVVVTKYIAYKYCSENDLVINLLLFTVFGGRGYDELLISDFNNQNKVHLSNNAPLSYPEGH